MLKRVGRTLLKFVALAGVFLLAAEGMSRLDDWYELDIPFLANPDRSRDLTVKDDHGIHGRPGGHFKKWQLNSFGFRGPEIAETLLSGKTRVMILGASETFGLYETEGKEYPAQLAARLPDVEVVNAAMAGITLGTMKRYWESYASRFSPAVVLIYPSPIFYLDEEPPSRWGGSGTPPAEPRFESRFAGRVKDTLRKVGWVRWLRLEYALREQTHGRADDWLFRKPPQDRLDEFRADLEALVTAVQARGAHPVLVTHAVRVTSPPRSEDLMDLREMRLTARRATEETIAAFEVAAAQVVRDIGRERGILVIDAAEALGGERKLFADLSHFTDKGAAAMADLLAERVARELPAP
jgi:lysophospholipase L1-like esterase